MPTIVIDPDTEISVHHDAIAAAVVTLKIEITNTERLRAEAERIFRANETRIQHEPSESEVDSIFGTPDAPDLAECLNFLFPNSFPGGDVLDIDIRTKSIERH